MSLQNIYIAISSHIVGDYVLQTDYLARTKGDNLWHMVVHCVLYTIPFAMVFGIDWRIAALLTTHMVIDTLKAREHAIGYVHDQIAHLLIAAVLYF